MEPAVTTPESLLSDIKNYLNITWDDSATDLKIIGLIEDGIVYLDLKRGAPADYTVPGLPRTLLKDYVRYARDSALDVFENNYQALLLGMRNQSEVKEYVEGAQPAGGEGNAEPQRWDRPNFFGF